MGAGSLQRERLESARMRGLQIDADCQAHCAWRSLTPKSAVSRFQNLLACFARPDESADHMVHTRFRQLSLLISSQPMAYPVDLRCDCPHDMLHNVQHCCLPWHHRVATAV